MNNFDVAIDRKLNIEDPLVSQFSTSVDLNHQLSIHPDDEFLEEYLHMINSGTIKEDDDIDINYNDEYLNMTLGVPRGSDNDIHYAIVKKRVIDKDGVHVGKANNNLHIDSRLYKIEFLDGIMEILSPNVIVENLSSQVD